MTKKEKLKIAESVIDTKPETSALYQATLEAEKSKRKSANLGCLFAFLLVLGFFIAIIY